MKFGSATKSTGNQLLRVILKMITNIIFDNKS